MKTSLDRHQAISRAFLRIDVWSKSWKKISKQTLKINRLHDPRKLSIVVASRFKIWESISVQLSQKWINELYWA